MILFIEQTQSAISSLSLNWGTDWPIVCLWHTVTLFVLLVYLFVCLFVVYRDDVWLDDLLSKEKLEDLLGAESCENLDLSDATDIEC